MLRQINARLDEDFADAEIWAEPGRYICGTAVNLITSVIGVTERGGQPWYFLDEGLYEPSPVCSLTSGISSSSAFVRVMKRWQRRLQDRAAIPWILCSADA